MSSYNGTSNGKPTDPHAHPAGNGPSFQFTTSSSVIPPSYVEVLEASHAELAERSRLAAATYRARRERLERVTSWRKADDETQRSAAMARATDNRPADLSESLALQDFDFGRLWAEYHDINRPDQWFAYGASTSHRQFGNNYPFYRTEVELDWYRAASRWVAARSPHAAGFVRGVCGYVVNKGMICKAVPEDGTADPADARLCRLVERELEEFVSRVKWAQLQQDVFNEMLIDGEYFLHLFDLGDHVDVRQVLPELVRQPPDSHQNEWSYGVQTPADDIWHRVAYHIADWDGSMGFISPAEDIVHFPLRVPGRYSRAVKRAMPLFAFGAKEGFEHAEKVLRNAGIGVAVRQGFAYFEQWDGVSRESVTDFPDPDVTVRRTTAGTSSTRDYTFAEPGKVIRSSPGMNFAALPSSPETAVAMDVADGMLRRGGVILNAPSWLTGASGRDQGAYASDLVRESPAVKSWEMLQEDLGGGFLPVMERVRYVAVRCGRLPKECLTRVRLTMEHPTLESRNRNEEASQNNIYVQMGVKSRQQIATEQGLDYDKQFQENVEFQKQTLKAQIEIEQLKQQLTAMQGGGAGGQPPGDGESPAPTLPGAETGGDEPGEDMNPFGDVAESVLMESRIEAIIMEAGFTGEVTDKLGRKTKYVDGKRVAKSKGGGAGKPSSQGKKASSVPMVYPAGGKPSAQGKSSSVPIVYPAGGKPSAKNAAKPAPLPPKQRQSIVKSFIDLVSGAFSLADRTLNKIGDKIDSMPGEARQAVADALRSAMAKAGAKASAAKASVKGKATAVKAVPGQVKTAGRSLLDSINDAMSALTSAMAKLSPATGGP